MEEQREEFFSSPDIDPEEFIKALMNSGLLPEEMAPDIMPKLSALLSKMCELMKDVEVQADARLHEKFFSLFFHWCASL